MDTQAMSSTCHNAQSVDKFCFYLFKRFRDWDKVSKRIRNISNLFPDFQQSWMRHLRHPLVIISCTYVSTFNNRGKLIIDRWAGYMQRCIHAYSGGIVECRQFHGPSEGLLQDWAESLIQPGGSVMHWHHDRLHGMGTQAHHKHRSMHANLPLQFLTSVHV